MVQEMTAPERIAMALDLLKGVLAEYRDTGDWYGCVRNAAAMLEESLRSNPPDRTGSVTSRPGP